MPQGVKLGEMLIVYRGLLCARAQNPAPEAEHKAVTSAQAGTATPGITVPEDVPPAPVAPIPYTRVPANGTLWCTCTAGMCSDNVGCCRCMCGDASNAVGRDPCDDRMCKTQFKVQLGCYTD